MKESGTVGNGEAAAVIKEKEDHIVVPGRTSEANTTITLRLPIATI